MPRATQDTIRLRLASHTGLSPSAVPLSRGFRSRDVVPRHGPTTPVRPEPHWFGLFPVRSPLLGESLLFSFPAGTKMFQFPALASATKYCGWQPCGCRVVPFGNPGVKGRLRLTRDYRSLPRPSSPPRAKASAVRPSTLLMPGSPLPTREGSPVYLSFFTSPQALTTSLPSVPSAFAFDFAYLSICENLMLDLNLLVFNYCHSMS